MEFPYPVLQPFFHPEAFDCRGQNLQVFDFVRVVKIPDWYLSDQGGEGRSLGESHSAHTNCFGMIKYSLWQHSDGMKRWFGVNKVFVVSVISCEADRITAIDFALTGECVERISPNFVLSTLFINYDWTEFPSHDQQNPYGNDKEIGAIRPGTGRARCWPIAGGSPTYELIKMLLETPTEALIAAHEAALEKIAVAKRI
jgi:hypothetical protein